MDKEEIRNTLKGIGLQFFAEGGADAGNNAQQGNENQQDGGKEQQQENKEQQQDNGKTFTQEEVNKLTANEKRQGRNSVLKELGLDPNDKGAIKRVKELLESSLTQAEKDAKAVKDEKEARQAAELRAANAECKLAVLSAGCKSEYVEEVMSLVSAKVDENTTFEAAISAVKKKCAMFFSDSEGGTGRGQGRNRNSQNNKPGSFGSSLAENVSKKIENPYFTN